MKNGYRKFLITIFLISICSILIASCAKKSDLRLPKNFAKKVISNNKPYLNKEIVYEDYFDPSGGEDFTSGGEDFNINKTLIWKVLINKKGDWKKTVISIPENVEKQKTGSFNARVKGIHYDYDVNAREIDIAKVSSATKDPIPFYYVASLASKAIKNKNFKVEAIQSLLGHKVYLVVSKNYVVSEKTTLSKSRKKILFEDHYWLDATTGRIYKYVQFVDGYTMQSYEIKSTNNASVTSTNLSVNVPKGTKTIRLSSDEVDK
ncbi:MAG TPA: hypothetical protein ENI08_02985 [Candidatus Dependentiae bacterium]|nr:hypothetical protein [Candidatus Dependentiae bacterium]